MKAKALVCDEQQRFELTDILLPDPEPQNLVVRTLCSGVSIGTEFALIRNKISWGPYPLCTGYQGVGFVEYVGTEVSGFKIGDQVYFRDNRRMTLPDGRPISPVSGTHCDTILIDPRNTSGVALVPQGVSAEAASLFVMPAVGLYGVDMADPRMGQVVVVYGAGAIGLGVIASCAHRGCMVIAVDLDQARLAMAKRLGADYTINAITQKVEEEVRKVAPDLADVVFESTGNPECINPSIRLCRTFGKFVWQGNYGAKPVSLDFLSPHGKRLTMFFPCDDGQAPCRRAVLKNMASGALAWESTITHRVPAREAAQFFGCVNQGEIRDVVSAVIRWSEA